MTGLTGTLRLTRLALRRDRVTLTAWLLGLGLFMSATTAMSATGFDTHADLVRETQLMASNPAMRMLGLASGASVGGYVMIRDFVTLAILAALMTTFTVVRHTRQNEELGRTELLGATVVGRYAHLVAAVLVAVAANLVLAAVLLIAMVAGGLPVAGSLAAGAAVAGVGIAFVGVSAVACQLTSTTRGASGVAAAVLGLSFVLAGVGNMLGTTAGPRVDSAWPSWLSPIGWGQQMRPFGGDAWWPLLLPLATSVVLIAAAALLVQRRDVGQGLWAGRGGRARARPSLLSPVGLTWRLQRGALLGWAVGLTGFGFVFGALSESIVDLSGSAVEWYTRMAGTAHVLDAYRVSIIQMAGMTVAIYAVQVLLRMRTDESGGTLEPVLTAAVSRPRWMLGHVGNAIVGAVLLLGLFGAAMGLVADGVLDDEASQLGELLAAGLAQLPVVMVIGGAVVAAVGMAPRWSSLVAWAVLLCSLAGGPLFGPTLGLPEQVQDFSPFTHAPGLPTVDVAPAPLLAMAAIGTGLAVIGVLAMRRRDLALPA